VLIDSRGLLPVHPGSRILTTDLGLCGVQFEDPVQFNRVWTVHQVLGPIEYRKLGGIRVRVIDEEGFVSFVNQQDLELLLELARPGDWCAWQDKEYPGLNCPEEGWFGVCCDIEDLKDDLFIREIFLRQEQPILPSSTEIKRRIHFDKDNEAEELLALLWDKDPETGLTPDTRMETLGRRWIKIERERVSWQRLRSRILVSM
jgi:hypothetical protein